MRDLSKHPAFPGWRAGMWATYRDDRVLVASAGDEDVVIVRDDALGGMPFVGHPESLPALDIAFTPEGNMDVLWKWACEAFNALVSGWEDTSSIQMYGSPDGDDVSVHLWRASGTYDADFCEEVEALDITGEGDTDGDRLADLVWKLWDELQARDAQSFEPAGVCIASQND